MKSKQEPDSGRRENARRGRLHDRAKRRARQRLALEQRPVRLIQRIGWSLTEAAWTFQEKVLWPLTDHLRAAIDAAAWPIEQLSWQIRRRVAWPLRDRVSESDTAQLTGKTGRLTVGALCLLAVAAATAGAIVAQPDGSDPADPAPVVAQADEPSAEPSELITARTEPQPEGPTLEGIQPSFPEAKASKDPEVAEALKLLKAKQARQDRAQADNPTPETGPDTSSSPEAVPEEGSESIPADPETEAEPTEGQGSQATLSKAADRNKPLAVAERFATAFVAYEIGRSDEQTERVFRQTATRTLVKSLSDRPPRQPQGGRVPRARVYNVVAGPRERKQKLEVSVGLLRVDGVSELRLDLERSRSGWRVATVRG